MSRRRNELRNAAGLILKLRIIEAVQDLKISLYKQILVPSYFWLLPPHFVCSADGTVAARKRSSVSHFRSKSIYASKLKGHNATNSCKDIAAAASHWQHCPILALRCHLALTAGSNRTRSLSKFTKCAVLAEQEINIRISSWRSIISSQ